MPSNVWNLFLVEDNDDDAFITERAIRAAELPVLITRCKDGQEAVARIEEARAEGVHSPNFPHLTLLDLKIPLKSGLEVLRWIRNDPDFSSLIVVALTS